MASLRALAERRAVAVERLEKAKQSIAKTLGVTHDGQPITNRDSEMAQVQQIENTAALLEKIVRAAQRDTATKPKNPKKPARGQ